MPPAVPCPWTQGLWRGRGTPSPVCPSAYSTVRWTPPTRAAAPPLTTAMCQASRSARRARSAEPPGYNAGRACLGGEAELLTRPHSRGDNSRGAYVPGTHGGPPVTGCEALKRAHTGVTGSGGWTHGGGVPTPGHHHWGTAKHKGGRGSVPPLCDASRCCWRTGQQVQLSCTRRELVGRGWPKPCVFVSRCARLEMFRGKTELSSRRGSGCHFNLYVHSAALRITAQCSVQTARKQS